MATIFGVQLSAQTWSKNTSFISIIWRTPVQQPQFYGLQYRSMCPGLTVPRFQTFIFIRNNCSVVLLLFVLAVRRETLISFFRLSVGCKASLNETPDQIDWSNFTCNCYFQLGTHTYILNSNYVAFLTYFFMF